MKILFAALLLVMLASCSRTEEAPPRQRDAADTGEGRKYIVALVEAVRNADRIVVTEHSDPFDLIDAESRESLIPDDVVYASRVLDAQQKAALISLLQGLDPATQDAFPACIPEEHHAIALEGGKGPDTVMEICFQCGQVDWTGATAIPPWSLYDGLKKFITGLGMQPKQDWTARAKAYKKIQ